MALFKDLLKKWFYTNSSQAASETARVPLLDASGNPIGSDTMTNIASVLGGIMLSAGAANYDFNNLTAFGTYAINNTENWNNKPSDANGSGFVICGGWNYVGNRRTLQVLYLQNNTAYFRAYNPSGSSWQSWQKFSFDIPSFYKDYADLSSLASALGIGNKVSYTTNISAPSDLDNATNVGSFACGNGELNTPTGTGSYGLLIVFKRINDVIQVFIPTSGSVGVKTRRRLSTGTWSSWV